MATTPASGKAPATAWRLARLPLAVAAGVLAAAIGLAYLGELRKLNAARALQTVQNQLQQSTTELADAEQARDQLEANLRQFEALRKSGFVGAPDRVGLIEALEQAARFAEGGAVRWAIDAARPLEAVTDPKTGSPVAQVLGVPMRLEADAVHEPEWLALLDKLKTAEQGKMRLLDCDWARSGVPYGAGLVPVIRAKCSTLWIHVQPPPPPQPAGS